MSRKAMLTTFDNPFDPFDDFSSWFLFDMQKHNNSSALLARFLHIDEEMTEKEIDEETERAIDELISLDFEHIYKKVVKEDTEYPVTAN